MHVAVDGSPLVEYPYSPTGLHLMEWLSMLQESDVHVTLLHPQGVLPPIQAEITTVAIASKGTVWSRLRFEQRDLPLAARELAADLLLVGDGRAPLASPCPIATVSSLDREHRPKGLGETLAFAAGRAGFQGASLKLAPADVKHRPGRTAHAPFVAHTFKEASRQAEDQYVLCHGIRRIDIRQTLSAWTWVDGSMGDSVPLTFAGVDPQLTMEIKNTAAELGVSASIRTRSEVTYDELPVLYSGAAAYLGTNYQADGQALRWALAAGTPVVGLKTPEFEAVLGGAAYLVPPHDSRKLGAACLTVLIQERVSEPLREKGRQRAEKYFDDHTPVSLIELLTEIGEGSNS